MGAAASKHVASLNNFLKRINFISEKLFFVISSQLMSEFFMQNIYA